MKVQEEMVRRTNLRSGENGNKKRIYSSKYALSSLCTCEKCGDIYRRVVWNIRGKKSVVWRCCTRVENGPKVCNSPNIKEEDLQAAVVKAINQVLGEKSKVLENMGNIIENSILSEAAGQMLKLEERMALIQKEIAKKAITNQNYDDLTDELFRLRDEKERIIMIQAKDKGKKIKR